MKLNVKQLCLFFLAESSKVWSWGIEGMWVRDWRCDKTNGNRLREERQAEKKINLAEACVNRWCSGWQLTQLAEIRHDVCFDICFFSCASFSSSICVHVCADETTVSSMLIFVHCEYVYHRVRKERRALSQCVYYSQQKLLQYCSPYMVGCGRRKGNERMEMVDSVYTVVKRYACWDLFILFLMSKGFLFSSWHSASGKVLSVFGVGWHQFHC